MVNTHFSRAALISAIEEVATNYVGELMARAASRAHLRRLGLEDERLSADNVDAVMQSLGGALAVLVGDRTASVAVGEIRRKIGHG